MAHYPTFELAANAVVNAWHLGRVLGEPGVLSYGAGMKKRALPGEHVLTLDKLGLDHNQSHRCQRLADMGTRRGTERVRNRPKPRGIARQSQQRPRQIP